MSIANIHSVGIVGGTGFIGRNLSSYLSGRGYDVSSVSRSFSSDGIQVGCRENISNTASLFQKTQGLDSIVWLANNAVPGSQNRGLEVDFIENTLPVLKYLDCLKNASRAQFFIYFSSGGSVYGEPAGNNPSSESDALNPISQYGFSKMITELHLQEATRDSGVKCVVLRPSNVFGPNQNFQHKQGIVGYILAAVKNGTPFTMYGDGSIVRDFVYVDDVCAAVEAVLRNAESLDSGSTFNVSSCIGHQMKDVVGLAESTTGSKLQVLHQPSRAIDCKRNVLNNNKIREQIGWNPKVDLEEGLKLTWKTF